MFTSINDPFQINETIQVTTEMDLYNRIQIRTKVGDTQRIAIFLNESEARQIAAELLSAADEVERKLADPITPIGDFQDSTPNNQ